MDWSRTQVIEIPDSGDARGSSFPVPPSWFASPFPVRDAHISTLLPNRVRGNHYHVRRNEILIVLPGSRWSLFVDDGAETAAQHRQFDGSIAVMICVPPLVSHAIRNDGDVVLCLVGLTDGTYDPDAPDAITRKITPS